MLRKIIESDKIEAHRNPTELEIKRGWGAIHYKEFKAFDFLRKDGTLKKWIKCPKDGLRYYR
jgi:hypothetical protein